MDNFTTKNTQQIQSNTNRSLMYSILKLQFEIAPKELNILQIPGFWIFGYTTTILQHALLLLVLCFVYDSRSNIVWIDLILFENKFKYIELNLRTYFGSLLNEQFSRAQLEHSRISNHCKLNLRTTILS